MGRSRTESAASQSGSPGSPGLRERRLQRRRHTITALESRFASEDLPESRQSSKESPEQRFSSKDFPREKNPAETLDLWWRRVKTVQSLPRYMGPLERLVANKPDLFEPSSAEAPWPEATKLEAVVGLAAQPDICPACQEQRSPSGWGSPGCIVCSGVEELCLPLEDHILGALLQSRPGESVPGCGDKGDEASSNGGSESDGESSFGGD